MNLIDWNIDQEREQCNEPPATGTDPYEPITDEDEGCDGFMVVFIIIILGIVTIIAPLLCWRAGR